MMAIVPDQSILDALRGYAIESTKQPIPRLVKIYISSTKNGKSFPRCHRLKLKMILKKFHEIKIL